ncbi:hypothetical protein BCV70DRAFT_42385 [Testicularia cyperi]|uniref:Uncharacterized protein n=1 Tax=Testicularia cyperi TaxID=1882483 RepID=A0A317XHX6_9BASI|nr:hypothetical protein BCV70DRAFT_42385 [Testicularia cyperi]
MAGCRRWIRDSKMADQKRRGRATRRASREIAICQRYGLDSVGKGSERRSRRDALRRSQTNVRDKRSETTMGISLGKDYRNGWRRRASGVGHAEMKEMANSMGIGRESGVETSQKSDRRSRKEMMDTVAWQDDKVIRRRIGDRTWLALQGKLVFC